MRILYVKAVIFDMDGVVTDTMPYHFRAWKKVYAEQGMPLSKKDVYLREGQPGSRMIREVFQERGRFYDEKLAKEMLLRKEQIFNRIVRPAFVPGARTLLRVLHSRNIRTALVTGTARQEVHRILPAGLLKKFDVVVTGDEVKHGKPNPEPFLKALKKLRLRPSETVVIENAPFGILSARKAHITCIALPSYLSRSYLKDADFVFSSYRDLRKNLDFALF